jgi:hypothetical protein
MPSTLPAHLAASSGVVEPPLPLRVLPYAHLTMKQLIIKALSEHFHNGATTRQLLDFFRDAWGRAIERQNLSPQLSRLYQEGVIGRIPPARGWFIIPEKVIEGFAPYLWRGRVVWAAPSSTNDEFEALLIHRLAPGHAIDYRED